MRRIFNEGYATHLSVGTVHVYVIKPDGHLLDSMHVAQAYKPENLAPMLEKAVRTLGAAPRETVVRPVAPSRPTAEPGSLQLHLVARYLDARGEPVTPTGHGDWTELPSEDWISLSAAEQAKALPRVPSVGGSWEPDKEVATRLLQHFYPPTENWEPEKNGMESLTLRGRVTTLRNGIARAVLEGDYRMKHTFYHKDDNNHASGTVAGWMEFDSRTRRIRTLHLVTEKAEYGEARMMPYGVAVLSR